MDCELVSGRVDFDKTTTWNGTSQGDAMANNVDTIRYGA
jgi:hypothetical protein